MEGDFSPVKNKELNEKDSVPIKDKSEVCVNPETLNENFKVQRQKSSNVE